MADIILPLPTNEEEVRKLRVGDVVYLRGCIFTSRDMGHFTLRKLIDEGKTLPVDFDGSAMFHAGPVVQKNDNGTYRLVVIGPTTSIRMEPYHAMVANLGVRIIIGKGGLGPDSLRQFSQSGQVYLQAAPGCAVVLAEGISQIKTVFFQDLGVPEALWVLDAHKFGPLVVGMDSHGRSIYEDIRRQAKERVSVLYGDDE